MTIAQKAGEKDQLFGSVTSKDVADALAAKNFTIDRRKIQLDEPIKQLGEFKVPVRLHKDVTAEVTVVVVKEELAAGRAGGRRPRRSVFAPSHRISGE